VSPNIDYYVNDNKQDYKFRLFNLEDGLLVFTDISIVKIGLSRYCFRCLPYLNFYISSQLSLTCVDNYEEYRQ